LKVRCATVPEPGNLVYSFRRLRCIKRMLGLLIQLLLGWKPSKAPSTGATLSNALLSAPRHRRADFVACVDARAFASVNESAVLMRPSLTKRPVSLSQQAGSSGPPGMTIVIDKTSFSSTRPKPERRPLCGPSDIQRPAVRNKPVRGDLGLQYATRRSARRTAFWASPGSRPGLAQEGVCCVRRAKGISSEPARPASRRICSQLFQRLESKAREVGPDGFWVGRYFLCPPFAALQHLRSWGARRRAPQPSQW